MINLQTKITGIASALVVLGILGACETTAYNAETNAAMSPSAQVTVPETGEGIFFPAVTSAAAPDIRFGPMLNAGPAERTFFSDQINRAATSGDRVIPIVVQAVGDEQQTLVFMALDVEAPLTPYIARAMLARMTSVIRFAPAISEMGISQEMDVYNVASILGFKRIIVTDGRAASYEVSLEHK